MITYREFRPQDASDLGDVVTELLSDGDPIAGITVEDDGRVVAYGGIRLLNGANWAFLNLTDEGARRPFLLHRTTTAAILALGRSGVGPVFTFCDRTKPRAEEWLIRLGFRPLEQHEKDAAILAAEGQTGHGAWILGG